MAERHGLPVPANRFLYRRIREMEGVEATGALSYNIEVTAGGINKGEALLWLAGELGIDREEILAFGDGANDADMIRAAALFNDLELALPIKTITLTNDINI